MLQGPSSLASTKCSKKSVHPGMLPSLLPKPFLQLNGRSFSHCSLSKSQPTRHFSSRSRTYKGPLSEIQGWDLGRFVKTLYFFNGPPSPAKVELMSMIWFCQSNYANQSNANWYQFMSLQLYRSFLSSLSRNYLGQYQSLPSLKRKWNRLRLSL